MNDEHTPDGNGEGRGGPSFRPAVAALVLNESGQLLVGRRNDSATPHWQFPQGGMKDGETPETAVLREMREELGTSRLRVLGVLPRRTRYVWRGELGESGYDGQAHIWFVLRLEGETEEEGRSEEFCEFGWIDPEEILEQTHPVRRATYQAVREMLLSWLEENDVSSFSGR